MSQSHISQDLLLICCHKSTKLSALVALSTESVSVVEQGIQVKKSQLHLRVETKANESLLVGPTVSANLNFLFRWSKEA